LSRWYHARRRHGVSEVEGAVLTIAITLIAGAALFGYVNDEAAVNEQKYGQAVGGTVNFLNERFAVVNMAFPSSNAVDIWLYNDGQLNLQVAQITLHDGSESQMNLAYPGYSSSTSTETANGGFCNSINVPGSSLTTNPTLSSVSAGAGTTPIEITLQLPSGCALTSGLTYDVSVLGVYGNVVTYYSLYDPGN